MFFMFFWYTMLMIYDIDIESHTVNEKHYLSDSDSDGKSYVSVCFKNSVRKKRL